MSEENWTIEEDEEEGQMVTLTIEAPNSDFQYLDTVGYTNGESDVPEAIQSYVSSHKFNPEYLMVVNLASATSGGSDVFTVNSSQSVFESANPNLSPNGAFIVFDTTNNLVKDSKKSKGKVSLTSS